MPVRFLFLVVLAIVIGAPARAAEPVAGVAGFEWIATATAQEKDTYVAQALAELETTRAAVRRLEKAAPTCVSASRLPMLDALIEVSALAKAVRQRWIQAGVTQRADAELRKIVLALSRARTLLHELTACSREESGGSSTSSVTYNGAGISSPAEGDEPFSEATLDGGDGPPEASPFL